MLTFAESKHPVFRSTSLLSRGVLKRKEVNQNPTSNTVWEEKMSWFKDSPQYRTFTTLQLVDKVQEFMTKMGDPSQFQGRIMFMSMFNDIIWV